MIGKTRNVAVARIMIGSVRNANLCGMADATKKGNLARFINHCCEVCSMAHSPVSPSRPRINAA